MCEWRNVVCGMMIVVLPASVMAQTGGAMLHSDGGVWLNGNPAPGSSAIFPHAVVQTQKDNKAKIDIDGSTAIIEGDTIVQFEGDELVLDHGSIEVNTLRELRVRVNCMTVIPVNPAWTRYAVVDVDGKMKVVANENDVKIHYRETGDKKAKVADRDVTVYQGEQVTREERCGEAARAVDVVNAKGAILNSGWAKAAGLAAIVIGSCFGLCHDDDPISPSRP